MDLEHKKRLEANTHLSDFVDRTLEMVQVFEEQGHLLFANKAWQETLGYHANQISSLNFYDFVHPQHLSAIRQYLQKVQQDTATHPFKTILLAQNTKPVHVSGSIFWSHVPGEKGVFKIVCHDISDQISAERTQRLHDSMASLSMQTEGMTDLYQHMHRALKKMIRAEDMYIALLDDEEGVCFPYYSVAQANAFADQQEKTAEQDLVAHALASRQPCLLYEEDILHLLMSTIIRPGKRVSQVWLGVPLIAGKQVTGMLVIQHFEDKNALGREDLALLHAVSGQIALVLEKKRKTEQQSEQTHRLKAIFESSTHLIWSIDRQLRFTAFNQNFVDVLQSHFTVPPVLHQLYNDEHPQTSKQYLRVFKDKYAKAFDGRTSQFEMAFRLGRDHFLWKQIFINPVYRADGSIAEVSGIAHDITQRKKSELALLESEEKFRTIFESFQDIYFRCNIDGTITLISPSVNEMADYETPDVIGRNITNYYLYDSRTKNMIRRLVKYKSVRNFEATIIRSDGELLQCICNVRLIEHSDRSPEIEGVVRDITELKKTTQALQKAKDVAEKSLRIKDAFLANMSHEIRTPMNGIISMIDVLDQTTMDAQQQEYVQIIKSSSETLLNILNDILDLLKIEAGKMKLNRSSVSISRIVHKLYRLFAQKAVENKISFSYHLDDDMPAYLVVDETRLMQILSNLTANALKFTPESGEVKITVSDITPMQKRQYEDTEHIIKIEVTDSGIGISEQDQKTLFQNFSQADSSSTKRYEGTGLGLSIAKQLVELMQGEINVRSVAGAGSTFWFTFRAMVGQEETLSTEKAADNGINWKATGISPFILLVDDNETNRRVAYEILTHAGCTVETAASGAKAIAAVQEKPYDLILMDIQMPEMDGIEATRAIRALGLEKMPPVVAMTAYSMEGDQQRFMEAGLDDYLAKPVRAHALIRKVNDLLQPGNSTSDKEISQNESGLQVINEKILRDLEKYGGQALIKDIFLDFVREAKDLIEDCVHALQNNDIDSILGKLHTLKGSAGTVGVDRVSQVAKEIEAKLKTGEQQTLAQDLLSLQKNFAEFEKQLQRMLNKNNNV